MNLFALNTLFIKLIEKIFLQNRYLYQILYFLMTVYFLLVVVIVKNQFGLN